jgi:DNA-binding NarL/FixJ family response regulator
MVRVLIADDDPVMRMLLSAVVNNDPGLELVGQAEDADGAITLAGETRPDVVLLDVEMPGGGGQRAAREIRAQAPQTRILALSGHERVEMEADGFLVKGAPPGDVARALRGN